LYTSEHRWLTLVLMMLAGALIRQFFVQRHGWHHGRAKNPWPFAALGVVVIAGVVFWMAPSHAPNGSGAIKLESPAVVDYAQVQPVLAQRCYMCHGEQVQMKNIRLDTPAGLKTHAQAVYQQVVVTRQMPMNNATGITDAERVLVGQWFTAGASVP
jgi:uncharacterized membrane protein